MSTRPRRCCGAKLRDHGRLGLSLGEPGPEAGHRHHREDRRPDHLVATWTSTPEAGQADAEDLRRIGMPEIETCAHEATIDVCAELTVLDATETTTATSTTTADLGERIDIVPWVSTIFSTRLQENIRYAPGWCPARAGVTLTIRTLLDEIEDEDIEGDVYKVMDKDRQICPTGAFAERAAVGPECACTNWDECLPAAVSTEEVEVPARCR